MRLAYAGGHALAGLAAEAGRDLQVVRDPVDGGECLEAIADQRRAAHGRGDLAVLDEVRLRNAEDEISGGRLDLAATERNGIEAALDSRDQLVLRLLAGREVGVRHSWHRQVPERLAAAVAGRPDVVLASAQQVIQVGNELSILDDRRALRGRAFVVDAIRPPLVRHAAVVVRRHERLGDHLAELSGPDARALLDVIGLQAVADGLVQEHAAEGVADDNRHLAAWRVDGIEGDHRLAGSPLGDRRWVRLEDLEADMAAECLVTRLDAAVAARDDLRAPPGAPAGGGRGGAPRGVELHDLPGLGVAPPHPRHPPPPPPRP